MLLLNGGILAYVSNFVLLYLQTAEGKSYILQKREFKEEEATLTHAPNKLMRWSYGLIIFSEKSSHFYFLGGR